VSPTGLAAGALIGLGIAVIESGSPLWGSLWLTLGIAGLGVAIAEVVYR
jgi:hypothetical protein